MSRSSPHVHAARIYTFEQETIAPVLDTGSFATNKAIWTSATPRARAATHSPLSDAVSSLLPAAEEAGQQSRLPAGKYIAYGTRALGAVDGTYGVGQHIAQGRGAETVTAGSKIGGGLAGAYAGAKAMAPVGAILLGGFGAKAGAAFGAGVGAFVGAEASQQKKSPAAPHPTSLARR
jgi:hypothetical protein